MTENKTPLVREDYAKMQTIIGAVWNEAMESGADELTLAHALIPLALERLLMIHDAKTVQRICERQIEVIDALRERMVANHEH